MKFLETGIAIWKAKYFQGKIKHLLAVEIKSLDILEQQVVGI